jgi:hypothetical protein
MHYRRIKSFAGKFQFKTRCGKRIRSDFWEMIIDTTCSRAIKNRHDKFPKALGKSGGMENIQASRWHSSQRTTMFRFSFLVSRMKKCQFLSGGNSFGLGVMLFVTSLHLAMAAPLRLSVRPKSRNQVELTFGPVIPEFYYEVLVRTNGPEGHWITLAGSIGDSNNTVSANCDLGGVRVITASGVSLGVFAGPETSSRALWPRQCGPRHFSLSGWRDAPCWRPGL